MRAPMLFSSDYKHFYCQYNESFYVKKLKLEMLTAVANESNTYEIGKCNIAVTQCFTEIAVGKSVCPVGVTMYFLFISFSRMTDVL